MTDIFELQRVPAAAHDGLNRISDPSLRSRIIDKLIRRCSGDLDPNRESDPGAFLSNEEVRRIFHEEIYKERIARFIARHRHGYEFISFAEIADNYIEQQEEMISGDDARNKFWKLVERSILDHRFQNKNSGLSSIFCLAGSARFRLSASNYLWLKNINGFDVIVEHYLEKCWTRARSAREWCESLDPPVVLRWQKHIAIPQKPKRGRHTNSDLYLPELKRRIRSGEILKSITQESEYLHRWLKATHPKRIPDKPDSVENIIRATYNEWKELTP